MTRQPNRLPPDARHGFGGRALDRSKTLSFRLNGRVYEGFEGDTVLSALLAAGVDGAGFHFGEAISLDERFGPPVLPVSARDTSAAMPMDRVPVVHQLDLRTIGPWQGYFRPSGLVSRIASAMQRTQSSLGHRLDDPHPFNAPWRRLAPARTIDADTIVVGGGLAGMSAALVAAEAGGRVVLVEQRPMLGGDATFFGPAGDEEAPEAAVARLRERVAATPSITVLLRAEAMELTGTRLRAHQVDLRDGEPEARVVAVSGHRVVLATGTAERLPVFPGNRMPGVAGAVASFHQAEHYGVWRGRRAVFSTPHNYSYRLALLAADAGVTVLRIADSRHSPQSRYIDFCKASGLTLASSLVPRSVESASKRGPALSVAFAVALEEARLEAAAIETDLFVAAGSWQPRLALWLTAGGRCAYDAGRRWIGAEGGVEDVALAGSAAGYRSTKACMLSGERAVIALIKGQPAPQIEDVEPGAIYESRDDATAIAPWRTGRTAGYLDRGATFTPRPVPAGKDAAAAFGTTQLHSLSLGDVVAAVALDTIPATDAGTIAAERCTGGGEIIDSGWRPAAPSVPGEGDVPAYLRGRYGTRPQKVLIASSDSRFFEVGCLVYPSSDQSDPSSAVGVVIGAAPGGRAGGLALLDRAAVASAPALFVRDTGGAVAVAVVEKLKTAGPAKAEEAAP